MTTTEDKPTTPDAFDPDAVQIERHRQSVTQGEVSVFYRGELLGRFGDNIVLCTDGSNGREPHPHDDGASCFGGFHGRGDRYWIDTAAAWVAQRAAVATPPAPEPELAGERETFEQQASEDGGRNWRTVAVGLDAANIAGARERDAAGEGRRWRFLPETDNGAARLIAAKEAQLVATRNDFDANAARTVGGRSRTKQFGRRVDAQLRRAGQLHREVERLESEIRGLRRRASEPEPPPLDLNRLPYAKAIRTGTGWYRVLKVNRASVTVEVPPGWDNRIPLRRIREIRERADAPAAVVTVISGPHAPTRTVRVCDVGGEEIAGSWWLVSATGQGWMAGRGAACAEHAGQPAPDASAAPLRSRYSDAVTAAQEATPFVSGWAAHATNSEANA